MESCCENNTLSRRPGTGRIFSSPSQPLQPINLLMGCWIMPMPGPVPALLRRNAATEFYSWIPWLNYIFILGLSRKARTLDGQYIALPGLTLMNLTWVFYGLVGKTNTPIFSQLTDKKFIVKVSIASVCWQFHPITWSIRSVPLLTKFGNTVEAAEAAEAALRTSENEISSSPEQRRREID